LHIPRSVVAIAIENKGGRSWTYVEGQCLLA